MPLFGFICEACAMEQELLVRNDEVPVCTACGSDKLEKQLSHFMPLQGSATHAEPVGCGASQCCQMQGGCCPFD